MDIDDILTKLTVMAIGAVATWICDHMAKQKRDLDAAFCKIRRLEDEVYGKPDDRA